MTRIVRVFPRRTAATPVDELAYTSGPGMFPPECDEVHISWIFTYDEQKVEQLEREWSRVAPVKIGGPAAGDRGGEFTPGMYLKPGYVITSRGCPNKCWFCSVPKREGPLRELEVIQSGWNVLDDNLLACSRDHIVQVFWKLWNSGHKPLFTGGLEAARLEDWHVDYLRKTVCPDRMYFAYDTPDDYKPLVAAGHMLRDAGFTRSHHLYAYVLIGYKGDTFDKARRRLIATWNAGFCPYAMLWRGKDGKVKPDWVPFQREWVRPAIIKANLGEKPREMDVFETAKLFQSEEIK